MAQAMENRHGHTTREMSRASLRALSGHGDPGKFGRMFPWLDPLEVSRDKLFELAQSMKDPDPTGATGDNPTIPAGFTYLGQFIDHDLTLDLTPLDQQRIDPLATTNFRSPALDLDSLYGQGSQLAPYMFARDPATNKISAKMLIGRAAASPDPGANPAATVGSFPNDLPRSNQGRAVIGDERNDENLLVAQTHLAFLKFHNAVVDHLGNGTGELKAAALFEEARRIVRWHYQWIVLFDFVERLVGKGTIARIKHDGRRFYRFRSRPYMPVEFAAAGYRLGHSMVRESYDHNRIFGLQPGGIPGTLGFMFHFTGKSGGIIGDLANIDTAGPGQTMRFFPSNWIIDWRRYYKLSPTQPDGVILNATRLLDPQIVPALHTLPGESDSREKVLAFRNLQRGVMLELPSGQAVAKAIGTQPLTGDELGTDVNGGSDGTVLKAQGLQHATPLWYYILKEAQLMHGGQRLGPVGATIIAECFLGFVHGDHESFMWKRSAWMPELPRADSDTFTMVDMLNFVQGHDPIINPLG
ncbi:heme peroxidase family protein [Paracoccus sp. NFXS7]|uniref:peroxidase family protein n=1 Tax=Paracoccus sp. NFXS7 TaxID=2908653 RepID=UPI0032DE5F65